MIHLMRSMARMIKSRQQLAERCQMLQRGNTDLLEALMDMTNQHCRAFTEKNGSLATPVCHRGISANEAAIDLLVDAGMAERHRGEVYHLCWDKLEARRALHGS